MTKFKPKGKVVVDHTKGSISQKRTPQGMTSHKHDSAPKCFYCGKIGHVADADQNQDVRLFMAEIALTTEEDE